jgi:hypothetical protein
LECALVRGIAGEAGSGVGVVVRTVNRAPAARVARKSRGPEALQMRFAWVESELDKRCV